MSASSQIVAGAAVGVLIWIFLWMLGVWAIISIADGFFGAGSAVVVGGFLWRSFVGRRWLMGALGACLLAAVVIAATPLTEFLLPSLIRRDPISSVSADAVMVLSAGVSNSGLLNSEGLDRFLTGAQIIREGRAPILIVSRPAEPLRRGHRPDRDWAMLIALLPHVPNMAVLDSVETTHDEATHASRLMRARGWHRMFLVTSPLHTRRACATFEYTGISVTCLPSESRDIALPMPSSAEDRLAAFSMWLHETCGWYVYRWRRWA